MRKLFAFSVLAAALAAPLAADAQTVVTTQDDVAYRAMLNKDWTTAERQLLAGLERNPENVFRMLNLAWVYAQTGRTAEASKLYHQVIDSDRDQLAALPSRGGASAKALAQAGLARLEATR
jgi:Tfp pilus assembly protein PilF